MGMCLLRPAALKETSSILQDFICADGLPVLFLRVLFASDDLLLSLVFIVEVLKYHKNTHFVGLPNRFCPFNQLR